MIWSVSKTGIGFCPGMPWASGLVSESNRMKLRTRSPARLVYWTVPLNDSEPVISAP